MTKSQTHNATQRANHMNTIYRGYTLEPVGTGWGSGYRITDPDGRVVVHHRNTIELAKAAVDSFLPPQQDWHNVVQQVADIAKRAGLPVRRHADWQNVWQVQATVEQMRDLFSQWKSE